MRTRIVLFLAALFLSTYTHQAGQTVLIPYGATWKYRMGYSEASNPTNAWRALAYSDSAWLNGQAPIGYSTADPKTGYEATISTNVPPSSSAPNWTSIYFRKTFNIADITKVLSLTLEVNVDDGAVAWINGVEAGRINVADGELSYTNASILAEEQRTMTVTINNLAGLSTGQNVLAIQGFNGNTTSSDFVMESTLIADLVDTDPPVVSQLIPPAGSTNRTLNTIEVFFNEPVTGVDASDLLINGTPATQISFGLPGQVQFQFPTPATGVVQVAWAPNHGITDMAPVPNAFAGGNWTYVFDPNLPVTTLVLNEFMADGSGKFLRDEDGDNSDWLEIYNPGVAAMDLGGWFLTDSAGNLSKWRFPNGVSIQANAYMIVFASNKNKTNAAARLHTNFRLTANAGGYLALVDTRTNVVSEFVQYPAQQKDVSYGRDAGDINVLGYFTTPTPGARNQSGGAGFAPEIVFSRPSGTFNMTNPWSLNLSLSTPVSGGEIRYAFGTNIPTATATLYTGSIPVTNTVMVRARAFAPGLLPGSISSRNYIALANTTNIVNFNSHLPILILHDYGRGAFPQTTTSEREVLVQTFEPVPGGRSSMTNAPNLAEFGIAHLRGSSTLGYAKGSFFMEVQDEFRDGKAVPLLGLPDESDWVLYAPNNFEPALFHNPLAHQLTWDMNEYSSRTRFVEVFLKDDSTLGPITDADYNGIYVLEEKIKRDKNRVNVEKLEPEHKNIPEVTGGYILSIDRTIPGDPQLSAGGGTFNYLYPKGPDIVSTNYQPGLNQLNYLRNYLNNFNSVLNNNNAWTNSVTGYVAYIDVESWVRRHIHEVLTFNVDALRLSGYFFKDRNKKIEYGPAWDYDRTQGSTDGRDFNPRTWRSQTGDLGTDFFNFAPWWNRLFNSPDFWQAWIDKYAELRDGPLSLNNITNRIEQLAAQIRPAHARELAKWNIAPRSGTAPVTVDSASGLTWTWGTNGYENEVRFKGFWYSNRLWFMDTQFLARPTLSNPSGQVSNGVSIAVTPASKAGSSLFYTLDGSDPRLPSGGISPTAFSNNSAVSLTISTNVKVFARSWNPTHRNLTGANNPPISSPWSAPAIATYYTQLPPLRITEIMYHPQNPPAGSPYADEDFEYIELRNISGTPLNVQGYKISGGIDFVFPNMVLSGGQRVMVVRNRTAFQQRYGTGALIAGEYTNILSIVDGTSQTNSLDNAGDRLKLTGRLGEPILDFEYHDDWYPITDGFGFSLVIVNDNAAVDTWGLKTSWRPSGQLNGSPGADDPAPPNFPQVVINEILTHSDPPPPLDTIELLNLSGTTADISGWFLTDDFSTPKKYRIANGTTMAAGGYRLFDESQFNTGANAFSLSSLGDAVYIFSADVAGNLTGYFHGFDFGAMENGRTFGRYITTSGSEQFPPQVTATLGSANAGPLVGPVVISEINYHPPDFNFGTESLDNTIDEYIELHNISSSSVALSHATYPTNTWHLADAVDFEFPQGVIMPPDGYLLVVSFNPTNAPQLADFRARNLVDPSVPIYGPFDGKLDNSSDSVELRRPDNPEPAGPPNFGLVPYILVERVKYSDQAPWPGGADGLGPTLQRVADGAYGNDPANWVAAGGSPGGAYGGGTPPVITAQPQDTTVVAFNDTSLSVTAQGSNLRYQWRFKGTILFGKTNSILQLINVQTSQAGDYDVVVINPAGSVVSSNAILTVLIPANIVANPASRNVNVGSSVSFSVSATSTSPITYQWYYNTVPARTNLVPIAGATGPSYTIGSVDIPHRGFYRVKVTDSVGSVFSEPAELVVLIQPVIVQNPSPLFLVTTGSTVTLSIGITNTATLPIGYRWRRAGSTVVSNYLNSYSDFLIINNVQGSNNYDVAVYNIAQPGGRLSGTARVVAVGDSDGDGMPDYWEQQYSFNINDPSDANQDADGDGMTNLQEYNAGTNPRDANSGLSLKLVSVNPGQTNALLRFGAASNKTYTVQSRIEPGGTSTWQTVQDVFMTTTNRTVDVVDPSATGPSRIYQVVSPKQP